MVSQETAPHNICKRDRPNLACASLRALFASIRRKLPMVTYGLIQELTCSNRITCYMQLYREIIGQALEDDHIRIVMKHSFLLPMRYPYFPSFFFFFFFLFLKVSQYPSVQSLIVCITFSVELEDYKQSLENSVTYQGQSLYSTAHLISS